MHLVKKPSNFSLLLSSGSRRHHLQRQEHQDLQRPAGPDPFRHLAGALHRDSCGGQLARLQRWGERWRTATDFACGNWYVCRC